MNRTLQNRMQVIAASSFGKTVTSLFAIVFYLVICSVTQPRRAIEFLKSVYRFRRADRVYTRDRCLVRTVEAEELFPGIFDSRIELTQAVGQPGSLTSYELYLLAGLTKLLSPRLVVEIGTFEGRTTLNMALNCSLQAEIYTIDLPSDNIRTKHARAYANEGDARKLPVGGHFHGHPESKKIKQLWGDSASYSFDGFYGRVDLVFVDGDHSFEYVKSDSHQALKMINPEGIVVWHDYDGSWVGVANYLRELAATRELCHINGTSFVVTHPSRSLKQDSVLSETLRRA